MAPLNQCPYCGEQVDVAVDPGCAEPQEYVEDCPVCCRPWNVTVIPGEDGPAEVVLSRGDE